MKKVKMIVVALLISASTNAQITLENTYNVSANTVGLTVVQLANSGAKYVITEPAQHQIKLYNTNHSLWKTITVPSISGYTFSNVMNISENLFNLDGQVEFVAYYFNVSVTPVQYHTKVINESGTVIKDLPNRMPAGVVTTAPNTYKLLVSDANLIREVYSLPGTSSNLGVLDNENTFTEYAYPNPTSQFITLPYNLNGANAGVLNVYNLNGQVVESFNIDTTFDTILLDVSNYATGMYRYGVVNGTEVIRSFVKE